MKHLPDSGFTVESKSGIHLLTLASPDNLNRLTRKRVLTLTATLLHLLPQPLIISGNSQFFSVGADLHEIEKLTGPDAYEFSMMGQTLMHAVEQFPAPVYAAMAGHCMGGGLDLALACHHRIASPNAMFGHRGAALGLLAGWGGTQRLSRLVGKAKALELFVTAETFSAEPALQLGLVDAIADHPKGEAARLIAARFAAPGFIASSLPAGIP